MQLARELACEMACKRRKEKVNISFPAAWVSLRASLTVRRICSKLRSSVQHVVAQQLGIGGLGRKLLVQFVIYELLYSST